MPERMTPEKMKQRTKDFALRVIRLVQSLPRGRETEVVGRQLLKAGTSVASNYRASCRSRSDPDFLARMGIVEAEADESLLWMEILVEGKFVPRRRLADLMREAEEILRIVVASITTVKSRRGKRSGRKSEIRNPKSEI